MEVTNSINEMALRQLDLTADRIGLDLNVRARLGRPNRALIVSVPTRMDNDSVRVFTGYRVQHNDALGPFKGGIRYHPDVNLGEVSALAMWMTWKCSLVGSALWRRKGRYHLRPHGPIKKRDTGNDPKVHSGNLKLYRPADRYSRSRHGNQ